MKGRVVALLVITALIFSFGCNRPAKVNNQMPAEPSVERSLLATVQRLGLFQLLDFFKTGEMTMILEEPGPYTLLAPTNRAFAHLPTELVIQLKNPDDKSLVKRLCGYHLLQGKFTPEQLVEMESVATLEGAEVVFGMHDGILYVNGAAVESKAIPASNGIIYLIDTVLIPPQSHPTAQLPDKTTALATSQDFVGEGSSSAQTV